MCSAIGPYTSRGRGEIVEPGTGTLRSERRSEQVERRDDADHQHGDAQHEPEGEPLLDDVAHLLAVAIEQERGQVEAHAARDERAEDEEPDVVAGEARR